MGCLPETASGAFWGPGKKQFGNQGPEARPCRPPASTRLYHTHGAAAGAPQERAPHHHWQSSVRAVPRERGPS